MNKIDVCLSNEHPDMNMNFNTLQYFQVLEQNDTNHERNAQLLSLFNNKNNWSGLCYVLSDKGFDNKVHFENKNIKTFHHASLYHCGYGNKD